MALKHESWDSFSTYILLMLKLALYNKKYFKLVLILTSFKSKKNLFTLFMKCKGISDFTWCLLVFRKVFLIFCMRINEQ